MAATYPTVNTPEMMTRAATSSATNRTRVLRLILCGGHRPGIAQMPVPFRLGVIGLR